MKTEVKVGAFTLGGIAMVMAVFVFLTNFSFGGSKSYDLYVNFEQAIGLMPGDSVAYAGVSVGRVDAITPNGSGVLVAVKINNDVQVPRKSTFTVTSNGVMGSKFVNIQPDKDCDMSDCYRSGEYIEGAGETGLDNVMAGVSQALKDVHMLLASMNEIMGNDETMKILSILQNALVELNLKGKNIMFVATGSEDIFNKIQDKLDSTVRIFEPYLIGPLSYGEVCDAINIPAEEQSVVFEEDVLKEIYELSNGIPYYMQILAYSCFEENNDDNEVTMAEFKNASVYALNILAQREFKALFDKSTTEERKILCLMAESDETILSYSYIKENSNLNSEPSALLKNLVNKNMIIKPSRGKYKLKNNLFKLYLQNLRINQKTGLINY